MSKYKCIIFDCDGVLVDSELIGNRVLVDMANAHGAQINLDYAFSNFKGNSFSECMRLIEALIEQKLPRDFEREYRQKSFQKFKEDITPVDGVEQVLNCLTIPFCVASSGPRAKIELNLELTGLKPYFQDAIFSCYEIQRWKPDPAVFLWAADTMGFKPQDCLIIEDSIIGVEAAKRGGFDVFGFTAQDTKGELGQKATNTFDNMLILPELL